jgi:hypothetical protein
MRVKLNPGYERNISSPTLVTLPNGDDDEDDFDDYNLEKKIP